MAVRRLVVTNLRNLGSVDISPHGGINLIVGANGSGKTSLLESIYLIGRGRSRVAGKPGSLIRRGENRCTVFARVEKSPGGPLIPVGVLRSLDGKQQIKVANDPVGSSAPLAELLPLQIINPASFRLLDGGPKSRRQFIDWGVFHVEHTFMDHWKKFSRCLKQRNHLLRQAALTDRQLATWDDAFIVSALSLTTQRQQYVERLKPIFTQVLTALSDLRGVEIEFYPGWKASTPLPEVLAEGITRDRKEGYTHYGPQRAELVVKYLGLNAADTLSRGQQKLVVCAMKIAQGVDYRRQKQRRCVYLIDDLSAELDRNHRAALCAQLAEMQCQLFVTGVEEESLGGCWGVHEAQVFHVKQGQIVE